MFLRCRNPPPAPFGRMGRQNTRRPAGAGENPRQPYPFPPRAAGARGGRVFIGEPRPKGAGADPPRPLRVGGAGAPPLPHPSPPAMVKCAFQDLGQTRLEGR